MAASSSSSSSATPEQLIEKIINTNADLPDFDLTELVNKIDELLARYAAQLGRRNRLDELPSASDASNFAEQVPTNIKQIASELKEYSGNNHETSIAVLNSIGNIHWVAVGLLVVGAALNIVDTIQKNKEKCLKLLKSMNDLAKVILQLQPLPSLNMELQTILKESIHLIVDGAIICCSQKQKKGIFQRVWKASTNAQELERLNGDIDEMRSRLHLQISTSAFKALQVISPSPVPIHNDDTVGIEEKIKGVIQQLDLDNDSTTRAVIVYGIGGSGKTTLADEVYASLANKLNSSGWKHSRVTLIQNLERNPKIEELQSMILQDITGTKPTVRDFQSGRQSLKDILVKECVFLYVDNALFLEPLEKLLPTDVRTAKKFRLLLTARETTISGVTEACGVNPCKLYPMEPLSIDAAQQFLCRKIDINREKDSILEERPQARQIAQKCNSCPLFLKVIGAFLHQRKNKVEAYESVLKWLKCGEDFSGSKNFIFDEKRVLFSYEGLMPKAQEAFLDLCSFFYGWNWETVECIVGEEEMECLEEAALIKREDKKIKIHDLVLAAGRHKSKHNRFKNKKDISLALKNKEQVSEVEGIWIEHRGDGTPPTISAEELDATKRSLRILFLSRLVHVKGKCHEYFDQLRFLHVGNQLPFNISIFKFQHLRYLSISSVEEDIILSPSMNCPNLNALEFRNCRIHGIAEIGHIFSKLKQLELTKCNTDGISQCFSNLQNLLRLRVSFCSDLIELPESLCKLRYLRELEFSYCRNLKRLPVGFGELVSLTVLDLSECARLQELPRDLEKLPSLHSLIISWCSSLLCLPTGLENSTSLTLLEIKGCASLKCLPHRLGGMIVSGSHISMDGCSSLSELPEEICKHAKVTDISLHKCSSLKMLPGSFGQLSCLQYLDLSKCESLQELSNDFHCLVGLKTLKLSDCKKLWRLPLGFGKLSSLEEMDLSGCGSMEELCSDFHRLVGLKILNLSHCKKLSGLPLGFGKLSSLEDLNLSKCDKLEELCSDFHCLVALIHLNLSGCSNLVSLSDDFHLLQSLIRLDLSYCQKLGGEWIDSAVSVKSLWRVDIVQSEGMIERWMGTKRQKERNLLVVTDIPPDGEGQRALMLEVVLSKVFDEEGVLLDAHQLPFHSSSLLPQSPLILIIASKVYLTDWKIFGKNLQQLQLSSKELQIIYVGKHYKSLQSVLPMIRILGYTPDDSSFCHKLYSVLGSTAEFRNAVFRSSNELEKKGLKCLSVWEDISSYVSNPVAFLMNTPRESNIDLLRELLVTENTDYLLLNENQKVIVGDQQGKIILLLGTFMGDKNQASVSAVKEMYVKMQESRHHHLFQVVWVPIPEGETWEEFERAVANAPWPRVPNPWLAKDQILPVVGYKIPCVCVVDEKGRISNGDALATIDRWGEEAFPFSQVREEELWKAEWEAFKSNSLSTLQFLFQNLDFLLLNRAREKMVRGGMMLICVGPPQQMKEVVSDLNRALTMLEIDFHVVYVGKRDIYKWDYDEMGSCEKRIKEEKESEMCSIETLPLCDMYKFWRRFEHLQKDLMSGLMGREEMIVKVRRMVFTILAKADRPYDLRILVVDGNGEVVSGRGIEMVELLCGGEEENKVKFVEETKKGGIEKSMQSRWRDGIIHLSHFSQHPLFELWNRINIGCRLCGRKHHVIYQCIVCEKYVICKECVKRGV